MVSFPQGCRVVVRPMSKVTTLVIIQGLSRRLRGLSQSKDRRHALIHLRWTATLSKIQCVGVLLSRP